MIMDMDIDTDTCTLHGHRHSEIQSFGYQISETKFDPMSDMMSDSALFSPIREVAIAGSV